MLVEAFLETVRKYGDKPAVKDPSRELTFSQLATFAQALRGIILTETQCPRVGLMLPTTAAGIGGIVATLWAGRTFVPLNFLLQPAELGRIIKDAGIDLVVTTVHFQALAEQLPVRVLYLEKLGLKRRYMLTRLRRYPDAPKTHPDDVAAIVYTSATTGQAKGVCLTTNNFATNARSLIEHIRIRPEDRMLGVLPSFHVFGLTVLNFIPVLHGTAVTCLPRFVPQDVHRAIIDDRITLLIAVPSMYAALARLKHIAREDFAHVTLAASGGEPLPRPIYEEVCERTGIRIVEGYGMTETSPVISVDLPWAHKTGTVGPPMADVEVQLRDSEGKVIASRSDASGPASTESSARAESPEGELYVRGPLVMKGYYNRPTETAEIIDAEGWLRTGDIVRIDPEGYIRITGRAKDLIIVGGENVYPREIEEVLDQHPAVAMSAVIGRKDELRGEAVVGFVMLQEGCTTTPGELRTFCRKNLAGFKVPREIHVRDDLPRGPTGKVLKRHLSCLVEEAEPSSIDRDIAPAG